MTHFAYLCPSKDNTVSVVTYMSSQNQQGHDFLRLILIDTSTFHGSAQTTVGFCFLYGYDGCLFMRETRVNVVFFTWYIFWQIDLGLSSPEIVRYTTEGVDFQTVALNKYYGIVLGRFVSSFGIKVVVFKVLKCYSNSNDRLVTKLKEKLVAKTHILGMSTLKNGTQTFLRKTFELVIAKTNRKQKSLNALSVYKSKCI